VWDSTNATQFLHQRVAVLTEQLERNEARRKLAMDELATTTQLIRACAKRVAAARSARRTIKSVATSGKPHTLDDGNITLPPQGTT
jgi:hypothetical protein